MDPCRGSVCATKDRVRTSLFEASGWRFVACHYPSHAKMGVAEGVAV
jgi:hypothetical protein